MPTTLPQERLIDLGRGLLLREKKNGLCLTTDALLLAAFCRGAAGERAVEFGCGSGAVSLLLARRGVFARLAAVERDPDLCDLARRNVEENGFSDTVVPLLADIRDLDAAFLGGAVDAVVTNPPYFDPRKSRPSPKPERRQARQAAAGDLFDFAAAAARCLVPRGRFFAVWRPDCLPVLFAALRENDLTPRRMAFAAAHAAAATSLALVEAVRGGGEGLAWLPTLFLKESAADGAPDTKQAAALFSTGAWPA